MPSLRFQGSTSRWINKLKDFNHNDKFHLNVEYQMLYCYQYMHSFSPINLEVKEK